MIEASRRRLIGIGLALPALSFVAFFFVVPLALVLRVSFMQREAYGSESGYYVPGSWSVQAYRTLFQDHYFRELLGFTLVYGVAVALLSLVIGFCLALFLRGWTVRYRSLGAFLVLLPKIANMLIIVYGLKFILSASGPVNQLLLAAHVVKSPVDLVNNLTGAVIGKTYLIVPYVAILMLSALHRIDDDLLLAAAGLGAGPVRRFVRIVFPLCADTFLVAAYVSLIWGIGAFVSPYLLGSPNELTLAIDVQRQTFDNNDWPRGAATAVCLATVISLVMGLFLFAARLSRRWGAVR